MKIYSNFTVTAYMFLTGKNELDYNVKKKNRN